MSSASRPLFPAAAAAQARRETLGAILAHKARCQELPRPDEAEIAAMLDAYAARGGKVTHCPPVCVLPIQNGTGLSPV